MEKRLGDLDGQDKTRIRAQKKLTVVLFTENAHYLLGKVDF